MRGAKAEQAHLNFYQKREDPQTQQKVHGTETNSGLTCLGKDSEPPSTNSIPPAGRTSADRCSKLRGRHEEEARPSARAGRGRWAESPRPVLGNSGRLGPREGPLSLLKTATSARACRGLTRETLHLSPKYPGEAAACEQRPGVGGTALRESRAFSGRVPRTRSRRPHTSVRGPPLPKLIPDFSPRPLDLTSATRPSLCQKCSKLRTPTPKPRPRGPKLPGQSSHG